MVDMNGRIHGNNLAFVSNSKNTGKKSQADLAKENKYKLMQTDLKFVRDNEVDPIVPIYGLLGSN